MYKNKKTILKLSVLIFSLILFFGLGKSAKADDCSSQYDAYTFCTSEQESTPSIDCSSEQNLLTQCYNEPPPSQGSDWEQCMAGTGGSCDTCRGYAGENTSYCPAVDQGTDWEICMANGGSCSGCAGMAGENTAYCASAVGECQTDYECDGGEICAFLGGGVIGKCVENNLGTCTTNDNCPNVGEICSAAGKCIPNTAGDSCNTNDDCLYQGETCSLGKCVLGVATYNFCMTQGGGDWNSCKDLAGAPAVDPNSNGYATYDNCITGGGTYDDCKTFPGAPANAADAKCVSENGTGYVWSSHYNECRGANNAVCENDNNCSGGCSCDIATGKCATSVWGKIPGTGGCGAAPINLGTAIKDLKNLITTTKPTTIINKLTGKSVTIPTGSKIDPTTGAVYNPDGTQLLPPGSVPTSDGSAGGSGFTLCANGILSPVCGNGTGGSISTPGNYNGGLPFGSYTGSATGPKCGIDGQYAEVGGVCFPTNTGLSSAPVYVILSNLFSWLMGLFTTFAVMAFVISGIQYLTSAGNEDQIKTAKHNATYALIGIVIGLSGFIIISAVTAALSGQGYFF